MSNLQALVDASNIIYRHKMRKDFAVKAINTGLILLSIGYAHFFLAEKDFLAFLLIIASVGLTFFIFWYSGAWVNQEWNNNQYAIARQLTKDVKHEYGIKIPDSVQQDMAREGVFSRGYEIDSDLMFFGYDTSEKQITIIKSGSRLTPQRYCDKR